MTSTGPMKRLYRNAAEREAAERAESERRKKELEEMEERLFGTRGLGSDAAGGMRSLLTDIAEGKIEVDKTIGGPKVLLNILDTLIKQQSVIIDQNQVIIRLLDDMCERQGKL